MGTKPPCGERHHQLRELIWKIWRARFHKGERARLYFEKASERLLLGLSEQLHDRTFARDKAQFAFAADAGKQAQTHKRKRAEQA